MPQWPGALIARALDSTGTPLTRHQAIPAEITVHISSNLAISASLTAVNALLPSNRRSTRVLSPAPALHNLGTTAVDKASGRTLLHWAAATSRNVLLSNLAAIGADINASDRKGNTPLHTTVLHGLVTGVTMLLSHGAETGIRNEMGWTALHLAVITGNKTIVECLLNNGADIALRCGSVHQTTALHYAVMFGHLPLVRILLARGADVTAKSRDGCTVADCAVAVGREEVLSLVLGGRPRPVGSRVCSIIAAIRSVRQSLDLMFMLEPLDKSFSCVVVA